MQPKAPLICPACSTPVSIFGGRCPSCGAQLPSASPAPPIRRSLRTAVRHIPEQRAARARALTIFGAAVVLGVLGGGISYLRRTSSELAAAPVSVSLPEPPAPPIASADPLELDHALVAARRHAQRWDSDAHLVSLLVERVDKGKLGDGGSIRFEFGKPKSGQLGPRALVGPERLIVTRTRAAQNETQQKGAPARSVADPNCPLEEAWRKTVASGIPSNSTLEMRYELEKKHNRAVWIVSVIDKPELTRTLDGDSCAILAR